MLIIEKRHGLWKKHFAFFKTQIGTLSDGRRVWLRWDWYAEKRTIEKDRQGLEGVRMERQPYRLIDGINHYTEFEGFSPI